MSARRDGEACAHSYAGTSHTPCRCRSTGRRAGRAGPTRAGRPPCPWAPWSRSPPRTGRTKAQTWCRAATTCSARAAAEGRRSAGCDRNAAATRLQRGCNAAANARPLPPTPHPHLEGQVLDRDGDGVEVRLLAEEARVEWSLAAAAELGAVIRLIAERRQREVGQLGGSRAVVRRQRLPPRSDRSRDALGRN